MTRKLLKSEAGVSLYQDGTQVILQIEEMDVINIDKQFKDMVELSYKNLVQQRKQDNKTC